MGMLPVGNIGRRPRTFDLLAKAKRAIENVATQQALSVLDRIEALLFGAGLEMQWLLGNARQRLGEGRS